MNLKHVIFDFGQVMIRFDPHYMTEQYIKNEDDITLVEQVLFDRLYWDRLDSADITDGEVLAACRERLPERLWEGAERVYYNWIHHLPEIAGMRELVKELKAHGKHVFLLSNISEYFAAHAEEISVLSEFEGCVFSAVVGMVKPNADIFAYICRTYGLDPKETLFVDDNEKNIRGAEAFGIEGYLFDGDSAKLKAFLAERI